MAKQKAKDQELFWILVIMASLIVSLLVLYFVLSNLNKIEYQGLTFTKERFGEIPIYHYYYYFNSSDGQLIKYNMYLRNDPRKNDIPVEGEISFVEGKFVYVSINSTGLNECPQSVLAVAGLSEFLTNNLFTVKAGTPNQEEAVSNNLTYINCDSHPDNPTILLQSANETKITQKDNCYIIDVADCKMLESVEKFEVQSIVDAKKRVLKESRRKDLIVVQ